MSLLTDFKADMRPGAVLEVTNHYVPPDHPKAGTTRRTITKVNSASFYTDADPYPMQWPKAARLALAVGPDGGKDGRIWKLFGGGAGQVAGDLFLTIKVVGP